MCQWRSKGGGDGSSPPRAALFGGAAELRLYLKIWERKKYIEGEEF